MPYSIPPRLPTLIRILALVLVAFVAIACGACSSEDAPSEEIAVDSLHADALIDLHLADARAEITGEPADSLRSEALEAHGLDSVKLSDVLEQYAEHPETAAALYEHATGELATERRNR